MSLILEEEGRLICPKCNAAAYVLFRRQKKEGSQVFENILWPARPGVLVPTDPTKLTCPDDGEELKRE